MSYSNDVFPMNSLILSFDLGRPMSEAEMDTKIEAALSSCPTLDAALPCGEFSCFPNYDTGQCQSNHML